MIVQYTDLVETRSVIYRHTHGANLLSLEFTCEAIKPCEQNNGTGKGIECERTLTRSYLPVFYQQMAPHFPSLGFRSSLTPPIGKANLVNNSQLSCDLHLKYNIQPKIF